MEEASYYQEQKQASIDSSEIVERLNPTLDRIYDQIERVQVELPKTEEVLHKVVEAAEHNQAIEKIFELRHEVKDDSRQPAASAATSMAELMKQKAQYMQTSLQATPHIKQHIGIRSHLPSKKSLYGQAITYGFITAVLSLFIAVIVVTVFT